MIKRYALEQFQSCGGMEGVMEQSEDGDWVKYEDAYAPLEAKLRMIVSHATMGQTDGEGLSVNGICVLITALRNGLIQEATVKALPTSVADIAEERRRQIEVEGWTPGHDDAHSDGELARAASVYARHAALSDSFRRGMAKDLPLNWPWERAWWKPTSKRRDLVKAGALIVAEIERLDRAAMGGSIDGN